MDFFWMNLECCRVARVSQPQLSFLVYTGKVYIWGRCRRRSRYDVSWHPSITGVMKYRTARTAPKYMLGF